MNYPTGNCWVGDKLFLGGCNEGYATNSIHTYYNATQPIPVQLRGANEGGICACGSPFDPHGASGSNWGFEWWQNEAANQDLLTVQTFQSGSIVPLNGCQPNLGFKNVMAKKTWHGIYGFNNNDRCAKNTNIAPIQTRYTQVSITADYNSHTHGFNLNDVGNGCNDGTYSTCDINHYTEHAEGSNIIDPNTGVKTNGLYITSDGYDLDYYNNCETCNSINFCDCPYVQTSHMENGAGWVKYIREYGCPTRHYNWGMNSIFLNPSAGDTNECLINFDPTCGNNVAFAADIIANGVTYGPHLGQEEILTIPWSGNNYSGSISASWDMTYDWTECLPDGTKVNRTSKFGTGYVNASLIATDIGYEFSFSSFGWNYQEFSYGEFSFSVSLILSSPYTTDDVYADTVNLLSSWNLTDDIVYPWRTDNYTMTMPKVARRELTNPASPMGFEYVLIPDNRSPASDNMTQSATAWFDTNAYYWYYPPSTPGTASAINSYHIDGSILGQPFLIGNNITGSVSGSNIIGSSANQGWGWFDFYYQDYRYCASPPGCSGDPYQYYLYAYGGSLADAEVSLPYNVDVTQYINILPKCSTHWVTNGEALFLPRGGDTGCDGASIYTVKYAEKRTPAPSINYFRPCGNDRQSIDETNVVCFIDDSLTLSGQLNGLDGSKKVLIAFSNGYDGVYTGCSQNYNGTNYVLTLGTKAYDLPSNYQHWFSEFFNDGVNNFGMVGLLRFPNAWSICGKTDINITPSGSTTSSICFVNFNNPQYNLHQGDNITLYNGTFTSIGNYAVATTSNINQFLINASYNSVKGAYYAMSTGAPDYHWNFNDSNNTFRYGNWNTSYRSSSFNSASYYGGCASPSACGQPVIIFSPNGESYNGVSSSLTNGRSYTTWFGGFISGSITSSFTGSISGSLGGFDGVYGNIYQLGVEWTMPDPLWQKPAYPCYVPPNTTFGEDDGSCITSAPYAPSLGYTIYYYPARPFVEAVISQSAGSPTMPVAFPSMNIGDKPPIPNDLSNPVTGQPWSVYMNEMSNCSPSCSFAPYYTACGGGIVI